MDKIIIFASSVTIKFFDISVTYKSNDAMLRYAREWYKHEALQVTGKYLVVYCTLYKVHATVQLINAILWASIPIYERYNFIITNFRQNFVKLKV